MERKLRSFHEERVSFRNLFEKKDQNHTDLKKTQKEVYEVSDRLELMEESMKK